MRDTYKVAGLVAALFMVAAPTQATDPLPAPPRIVASPTSVQPVIPAGTPVTLDVGKFIFLDITNYAGPITWEFTKVGIVAFPPDAPKDAVIADHFPGIKQGETVPAYHKAPSKGSVQCLGVREGSVTVSAWGVVDARARKIAELTVQVGPRGPPDVKPDDPVVPKPPGPVTSFRVFLVVESGANYTPAVNAVLYGNVVEEWLDANCTGGKAGWRRRDQNLGGEKDEKMAALWASIQPALTTVPCMAVEVNNKVEIIPIEATPAAMVAKLKTYRGK